MITKKTSRKILFNGDVLSFLVNVICDMFGLESVSNALYSDRKIVCHLLNAFVSKISINNVSNLCDDALCEGTIKYKLRNIDLDGIQQSLNEKLKIHAKKTVPRKQIDLAIDYTDIPYYGKEEK